ncbi:MAG: GerMN domain-containing protein [Acidiferrobacterales bacterium]|nr:GerMN domain-containing protein [Acidiferrobacterales bacterium]
MKNSQQVFRPSKKIGGKQRGVSFWVIVWGGAFFVLAAILATRSVPVYMNNQKIGAALEALKEEPGVMTASRSALLRKLKRRLNIDYADTYVNLDKAFRVTQKKSSRVMSINYEVVIGLVSNASLLFDFENEVNIERNPGGS